MLASAGNFYGGHNTSVDPSIVKSFPTAALRFGHSAVGNSYKLTGNGMCARIPIADFHNPAPLYEEGGVDLILRGLLEQSARKVDR